MSRGGLAGLLVPEQGTTLQWQTAVPIATNPFILLELFQMCLVGSGVGLVVMGSGLWLVGGGLHPGDIKLMLTAAVVFLLAVASVFLVFTLVVFGNRYYAVYHFTPLGIFYQGIRGNDASGRVFIWQSKPFTVCGKVVGKKSKEKDLPWEKVDRFIDFASMRSIQLKRGRWHMIRLYTPNAQTHERVVAYLEKKLQRESV